jgi:hypothetical protein
MLDSGIEIHELTDAQRAELVAATSSVIDEFKDELDPEILALLQETQKEGKERLFEEGEVLTSPSFFQVWHLTG